MEVEGGNRELFGHSLDAIASLGQGNSGRSYFNSRFGLMVAEAQLEVEGKSGGWQR